MKKFFRYFMIFILFIMISGCNSDNSKNTNINCTFDDCMKLISTESSVSEINDIIGIDGELVDDGYNEYYWKFNESSGIYVTYYDENTGVIKLDIDKGDIKNNRVSFAKINEIENLVNDSSSITYQEFVKMMGNVEGIIVRKSKYETDYMWVDENLNYVTATFSLDTNKAKMIIGQY